MLILLQSTIHLLTVLLNENEPKINQLLIPKEEIAPSFLLEFSFEKLNQDFSNAF